ncbi:MULTISPECIES: MIP/aquaporin family protein [unclassified Nocardioides]|uniref:MIP/aquaporin family protein n=1 Tax=unclassified Nocardioides TaxID=2615069 RepID=UPI00361546E7
MSEPTIQQKLTAEVIGTFVLVLFGCGSVVVYGTAQAANEGALLPTTITTVGLAFGLAVMVMVYAFGRVSGAHFNPAVSVGAAMGGRMAWREVGFYILAQLVGAVVGALALFLLMQGFENFDAEGNMGQNAYGDAGSGYAAGAAFFLELVLTAIFVTVILAVTDERNEHPSLAPLTIGFTLAAIHFVAIPATGTSVNPARSIGPALFAGPDAIEQLWLFILAPFIGGAIAGVAYPLLFGRASDAVTGSGIRFSRPRTAAQVPGYAAPDQYQQQWNPETTAEPAPAEQPIIQDGWQWDPVGQQWHPVGSTPEQWRAQQEAEQAAAARDAAEAERAPESTQWPEGDPGDGGTQIRPPHA